jgi:hypothetical protein
MSNSSQDDARSKRSLLAAYLREQARNGNHYFKSKFISEEVGLSPYEIGNLMYELQDASELKIEKWGNARATTWYVAHQE